MTGLEIVIAAMILDALIGDPDGLWRRYPHPAALMGKAISGLERRLNHRGDRTFRGVLALLILTGGVAILGIFLSALPTNGILDAVLASILLAQNSLSRHVSLVADALERNLLDGRRAVSMIVGRDPQHLDESGVARAAIESAAENFSDGVVAPIFWLLVAGLPGILVYKMINTADSMIGYHTPRYREFGWAAAKVDDIVNWLPARISGVLICLSHGSVRAFKVMLRDAPLHRSPNAGWPEAATAAVIGVAISGPRVYDGHRTRDPFVNREGRRNAGPSDIRAAVRVNRRSWAVLLVVLIAAALN